MAVFRPLIPALSFAGAVFVAATCPAQDVPDRVQGNWLGEWALSSGGGGKSLAQIVALGKGEYQAVFTAYDSGEQDSATFRFLIAGSTLDGKAVFDTTIDLGEKVGTFDWKANVEKDLFAGTFSNKKNYIGTLKLKRIEKKPDNVGMKPLPGSIVLFDGTNLDQWTKPEGEPAAWDVKEGVLSVLPRTGLEGTTGRHLVAKESFGSAQIHLEYRTPFLPEARGQERANSGVFLQGRYEIQIVDSFGQAREVNNFGELSDDDSAGAIYKYAAPTENVTLPPGEWQSLDITFLPPNLDAKGEVGKPAEITVVHNGTTIHDRVKVHKRTQNSPVKDYASKAGLILEDGGQAVQFRNIWMVKLGGDE